MTKVTPLFPTAASPTTAANSIYPPAPMIVDARPEDYEVDPIEMFSTRALWATSAGLIVALVVIAVLP